MYRRGDAGWLTVAVGPEDRLRLEVVGLDLPPAELYRGIPGLAA